MHWNPTQGCCGAQKSNGVERSWMLEFLDLPGECIRWQTRALTQL